MMTAETLTESARRSPLRRRVVGAFVATIAVATMVPTAALAQSNTISAPSADNYVPAPPAPPTEVQDAAAPPSCAPGETVSINQGAVVCSAAVQGDSGGSSGTLPQTGGSPSMMLGFGALAMLAGAMFLAAARRRRQLDGTLLPS